MAQSQVLKFEDSARAEDSTQGSEECREKNEHRGTVYESSVNGSRSDISRFSRATVALLWQAKPALVGQIAKTTTTLTQTAAPFITRTKLRRTSQKGRSQRRVRIPAAQYSLKLVQGFSEERPCLGLPR